MNTEKPVSPQRAYVNVMEVLVSEEVERQLQQLSPRILQYVKRSEVETYALNRLPALYASSKKGWQYQQAHANRDLRDRIVTAVRQAFAAVQQDPIRLSQPIQPRQGQPAEAEAVLQLLRERFQDPDMDWQAASARLKQIDRQKQPVSQAVPPKAQNTHVWRPGSYGREVSWRPKPSVSNGEFGWDDSRYRH